MNLSDTNRAVKCRERPEFPEIPLKAITFILYDFPHRMCANEDSQKSLQQ